MILTAKIGCLDTFGGANTIVCYYAFGAGQFYPDLKMLCFETFGAGKVARVELRSTMETA